jgi:hypothetical protein
VQRNELRQATEYFQKCIDVTPEMAYTLIKVRDTPARFSFGFGSVVFLISALIDWALPSFFFVHPISG